MADETLAVLDSRTAHRPLTCWLLLTTAKLDTEGEGGEPYGVARAVLLAGIDCLLAISSGVYSQVL